MKIFLLILFVLGFVLCFAQTPDKNYLNYYAVDNSIDNQPEIEKINFLRFFPVYVFQQYIDTVNVTIYYGKDIYKRNADPMDNKSYWQTMLPEFQLGEAIQRIEVEVIAKIKNKLTKAIKDSSAILIKELQDDFKLISDNRNKFKEDFEDLSNRLNKTINEINIFQTSISGPIVSLSSSKNKTKSFSEKLKNYKDDISTIVLSIDNLSTLKENQLDSIYSALNDSILKLDNDKVPMIINSLNTFKDGCDLIYSVLKGSEEKLDSSKELINQADESLNKYLPLDMDKINNKVNQVESFHNNIMQGFVDIKLKYDALNSYLDTINSLANRFDILLIKRTEYETKLQNEIYNQIKSDFSDTSYSGVSVQKSDIIIDLETEQIKILYRNYNKGLRKMPALDPGERIGIFRARFVPFPVTTYGSNSKVELVPMTGENSAIVFEFGIAFGDMVVPGDQFIVPSFSINRFGVVIAITDKLFSEDAKILALALSYDVNTYASISAGMNFAAHKITPYYSFGINKKAFEALLKGIIGIFK